MNAQPRAKAGAAGRGNARRTRRRGYGLVEVALAVLLVMVAMSLMVRALAVVGAERSASDRRLWAVQTAANVLERVASEPFDAVDAAKARSVAGAAHADRVLPGADWEVDVADDRAGPVAAKRVSVRLKWKDRWGGWVAPVRLTAWVFRGRARS